MRRLTLLAFLMLFAGNGAAADPPLVDGVSGAPLEWSDWVAKRGPVAVMVWASWAPEAQSVIADFDDFSRTSRESGLHPVLLDVQESLSDGRKALSGREINWIHDRHGGLLKLYRVITVPSVIVISAEGQLLQRLDAAPEAMKPGASR